MKRQTIRVMMIFLVVGVTGRPTNGSCDGEMALANGEHIAHCGTSTVPGSIKKYVEGHEVGVRVYSHQPSFQPLNGEMNLPVFVFGDLTHRALEYKQSHPDADVQLRLAVYKIEKDLFIGTVPGSDEYGTWGDTVFAGTDSRRLLDSLVEAAQGGVKVRLLYHNPGDEKGIAEYLGETLGEGRDNLELRRVNWPDGTGTGQQHNKFMLISHGEHGDSDASPSVYVTTANPNFKRWGNTGIRIDNHRALYDAYLRYFEKMFDSADKYEDAAMNQRSFWMQVREGRDSEQTDSSPYVEYSHASGNLNYDDGTFAAYFYPMPDDTPSDCWVPESNPVSATIDDLIRNDQTSKRLMINMFHWRYRAGDFSETLLRKVGEVILDAITLRIVVTRDKGGLLRRGLEKLFVGRRNGADHGYAWAGRSHAKDYIVQMGEGSDSRHVVITGSANAKSDAFNSKANNQLVVRESGECAPVAEVYRQAFAEAYGGRI